MKSGGNSGILWAPWRMEYILSEKEKECIFCSKTREDDDRTNLILFRGEHNFVIMNKYPYNNGHLMVVPYRHISEFEELTEAEFSEMTRLIAKSINALKAALQPEGFNIGMNVGKIAGAGIDDHLHFHIVPRWAADTNFMPVVGHTKVISEGLWETWDKLKGRY
ncbi:MAG: HIT domain-containing protein [Calditrichaeota bacterium]|nr:MAG: HIT domain-containing protein [Calditrichota bacterium]